MKALQTDRFRKTMYVAVLLESREAQMDRFLLLIPLLSIFFKGHIENSPLAQGEGFR